MTNEEIRRALARELEITGHHAEVVDAPSAAQPASGAKQPSVADLRAAFPSTRALVQWVRREFGVQLDLSQSADALYAQALAIAGAPAPATVDAHTPAAAAPALDARSASIGRLMSSFMQADDRRPTRVDQMRRLLGGG